MNRLIDKVPTINGDISAYIRQFDDYYKQHNYFDLTGPMLINPRIEKMLTSSLTGDELIITAIEFMENRTSLGRVMQYIAANHHNLYNYNTFQHLAREYQKVFSSDIPVKIKDRWTWKWEQWYKISLQDERDYLELAKKLNLKHEEE